jgi:hypothetical protein
MKGENEFIDKMKDLSLSPGSPMATGFSYWGAAFFPFIPMWLS